MILLAARLTMPPSRRETPAKRSDVLTAMSMADYADPSQQPSLGSVLGQHGSAEKLDFLLSFPDMRQSIIAAINELNDEVRSTMPPSPTRRANSACRSITWSSWTMFDLR